MNRLNIEKVLPESYKAMLNFSHLTKATSLTAIQIELIKIRASQINGCTFCLHLHIDYARKAGESELRIQQLPLWKQSELFTEQEKQMLSLTEEITLISNELNDETYYNTSRILNEIQIAEVIMTTVVINAWNRIHKV
jgi:AhpD family alkylhydroperoxidase